MKTSGSWQAKQWRKSTIEVLREDVNLTPNYSHFAIKYADAKIHTIFEGTSEIQQLVIARAISGLHIE
jgi:alkylation response protein AidB-like acyl-CoA dehydrogenase